MGDSFARIEPCDQLELDVQIEFSENAIGKQRVGLSKGGSLENAIVVDGDKILNPEGLRFSDEFVRHKALDLLGDLYLGGPILGRVKTVKGGHGLNHKLLIALYANPAAWAFTSLTSPADLQNLQSISA